MSELPTASINGLEIFSTGTWNGDRYDVEDLDAMVAAFAKTGWQPFVKAGHNDAQEGKRAAQQVFGAPALGYVEKLYRIGNKLLADIKDIPRKFYELIKAGSYRRVSAEVYWNYKDEKSGRIFPKVLKAIAFLGAEVPAVTNLDAVTGLYSGSLRVVTYNLKFGSERSYTTMENFNELFERSQCIATDPEAGAEVDRLVKERMAMTKEDYSTALHSLRHEAKTRTYNGDIGRPKENFAQRHRAGVALDARAKELVLARGYSYNDGLRRAMDEDPPTAREYGYIHDFAARLPMVELNNICSGHYREDGTWDWRMALEAAKMRPELVQDAAQERIEQLVDRAIAIEGVPGSVVNSPQMDFRAEMRRRIRGEYPSLARTALDGSAVDETALKQILWTKR